MYHPLKFRLYPWLKLGHKIVVFPCSTIMRVRIYSTSCTFWSCDGNMIIYNNPGHVHFFFLFQAVAMREQGWHSDESTRPSPISLDFDSRVIVTCGLRLFLVLVLAIRGFFAGYNSIWRVSPYCKAHLIMSSWKMRYTNWPFFNGIIAKENIFPITRLNSAWKVFSQLLVTIRA